jgi:hypothetical protein
MKTVPPRCNWVTPPESLVFGDRNTLTIARRRMACSVLLLSEKERAPAKAGATDYNKGEDNHAVKVSAVLFTGNQ